MGCCYSFFGFKRSPVEDEEDSEITRLLEDHRGSTPYIFGAVSSSEVGVSSTGSSYQDEMSKIIDEVDAAMIDISSRGNAILDKFEYNYRSKYYGKLTQGLSPGLLQPPPQNKLLKESPRPEMGLAGPLISEEDVNLMKFAMDEVEEALVAIKVENKEDFIVPYNISEIPLIQVD